MKSYLAIGLATILSLTVAATLYVLGFHLHYRELPFAIGGAATILITHMCNLVIYFKITGDEPYAWFKGKASA